MFLACPSQVKAPPPAIVWHSWSDEIFTQAAKEHKFVLLDLEAVWCHVMDLHTATRARESESCAGIYYPAY